MSTEIVKNKLTRLGRPKNINWAEISADDVKAVEKSRVQWKYISLKLAQQVELLIKKGDTPPAQLLTQAAIAFDKAFSKADTTDTNVTIPKSLELAIVKALRIQPVQTTELT